MDRPKRKNAGVNQFYNERDYCLVSFMGVKKHALVPSCVVNVDIIDESSGTIKMKGKHRDVRVIASGSKLEMAERSTRFSSQADSEELHIADLCEPSEESNDHQRCMPLGESQNISKTPSVFSKKPLQQHNRSNSRRFDSPDDCSTPVAASTTIISSHAAGSEPIANYDKLIDFDTLYGKSTTRKRRHSPPESDHDDQTNDEDESDTASITGVSRKKTGTLRQNIDLSRAVKRTKRRPKKLFDPTNANRTSGEHTCERLERIEIEVTRRLRKLEDDMVKVKKTMANIRRHQTMPFNVRNKSVSNTREMIGDEIYEQIETLFNVDVRSLKAPRNRPTIIMRELFRSSGHISDWKTFFYPHENLLKDFINSLCPIEEGDFDSVWASVILSLAQANHDAKSNAKKKVVRTSVTTNDTIVTGPQPANQQMVTKQGSASNNYRAGNENNQHG